MTQSDVLTLFLKRLFSRYEDYSWSVLTNTGREFFEAVTPEGFHVFISRYDDFEANRKRWRACRVDNRTTLQFFEVEWRDPQARWGRKILMREIIQTGELADLCEFIVNGIRPAAHVVNEKKVTRHEASVRAIAAYC